MVSFAQAEDKPAPVVSPVHEISAVPPLRSPLIVAAYPHDPFSYINARGEYEGFAVDLLDALGRAMDLKLKRPNLIGVDLYRHFCEGEFDMMQMFSQTEASEKYIDCSVPILAIPATLWVRRHDNQIQSFADLRGRRVAIVGMRSAGEVFLRAQKFDCRIVPAHTSEEGLRFLEYGQVDAFIGSRLTAQMLVDHLNLQNVVQLELPFTMFEIRQCFAVHKGDAALLARLNEGLAVLHSTGEFERIYQKWFGRYESPVFSSKQLITYVAATLALAFMAVTWGFLRQRTLNQRIAGQSGQLADKEHLLQALYDNIPMAMCVIEAAPDGHRLLSINRRASQLFSLTVEAATGCRLSELKLAPDWSAHVVDALKRWPTDNEIVREEHSLTGINRLVIITLVPLAAGANGLPRLCMLTEDITERRELDEEIAQTRKLRAVGELVGGIAHEFNNLLTPVFLKASELQVNRADDPRLQKDMDVIIMAGRRAAEMTQRLLTFGRKSVVQSEEVSLETTVSGAFALLQPAMDRRIVWVNDVPASLPPLFFNATDLNQIVLNLLLNARDALEEKLSAGAVDGWIPRIRVEAEHLPPDGPGPASRHAKGHSFIGWQRLTVHDNGIGITAAVRERIFEPFYTTKGVGRGTGLGLATVWHLATEAGGRVEIDSAPGEGSAFHVTLPVWAGPKPIPRPPAAISPAINGQARVMVVEDEELVALTIITVLERAGCKVEHIDNGAKAWARLSGDPTAYDLLILDVNLPGMDGIELARRVRTVNYHGRIVMASGRFTPAQLQAISRLHVDRLLPKPFSVQELLSLTQEVNEKQRQPTSVS